AAHKANIPVAVCGEMAADPLATLLLIGLELDELSMAPLMLPEIKKIIRSGSYEQAREIARGAFRFRTAAQVEDYLSRTMKKLFADLPVWFSREA
ncbi:MAG TPA: putative PEP-binding protein, partial [bacterium]